MISEPRLRGACEWLRSDRYDQGHNTLGVDPTASNGYTKPRRCCLGVMVEYAIEQAPELGFEKQGAGKVYYTENGGGLYDTSLPGAIRDWYGLDDCDPVLKTDEREVTLRSGRIERLPARIGAITANDTYNLPLSLIAGLFEATYLGEQ